MILKIILLVLIFIILALFLFFLSCLLVPAVKEQTKLKSNMLFSKIEHKFNKLEEGEIQITPTDLKAVVLCSCNKKFENVEKIKVYKTQSCALLASEYSSYNPCKFSCLGMGDCKKVCDQHAISIVNNTAIISDLCCGCGKCIDVCPKKIIKMVSRDVKKTVICSNSGEQLTGCSNFQKEENIVRPTKKYFKMWQYCYKMFKKNK